jgi:hypothetical protein
LILTDIFVVFCTLAVVVTTCVVARDEHPPETADPGKLTRATASLPKDVTRKVTKALGPMQSVVSEIVNCALALTA